MPMVDICDAEMHFSRLIDAAMRGEEIIIAKAGSPVARLGPVLVKQTKRRFGMLRGKIKIAQDFDALLSIEPEPRA